ncbi:ATP-grasp domain-containing protein [Acaryochloris marina NIES-2412]|uniref:ATP-grasp domain-containing protein n=1 Tax=Acaryochloris marina TaxID=155978 RepID=UPI004059A3CC
MRKNILFTGGGGAGTEAIWKIWQDKYSLYFADASVQAITPVIPHNRRVSIPLASDLSFCMTLFKVCQELDIDLLVPGVDEELSQLSALQGNSNWPELLLPSQAFVDLMLDKLACFHAVASAGLMCPRTLPLVDAAKVGFPLIAKPRSGRGSRGVMLLQDIEQVQAYLTLQQKQASAFIAQEYVKGQEYTVFVCADSYGQLRAVIPVKVNEKKGITILAKTEEVPEITEYVSKFQSYFKPTGVYNIQCVVLDNATVMPFEVNPRVSTTFCLALSTGFDPVKVFFSEQNLEPPSCFTPKIDYSLQRNWVNTIIPIS